MKANRGTLALALSGATLLMLARYSVAQSPGLVTSWSFPESSEAVTRDQITKSNCEVGGYYKYVQGVVGTGLRFDGYTTSVKCKAEDAPRLGKAFSVQAWVA